MRTTTATPGSRFIAANLASGAKAEPVDLKTLAAEIKAGAWEDLMAPYGASDVLKMTVDEIHRKLLESCGTQGGAVVSNCWFDIYWTAGWVNALRAANVRPDATVLEVGAGLSSNFIRAASNLLGAGGRFVSVNLNRNLTESFARRNRQLPIRTRYIEGNALHVARYLPADSCDFVALNHQIDDLVQTIVFEASGQTADDGDWLEMAPELVRLSRQAHESDTLETLVRPQFVEIIAACAGVLKPGGLMGFNHAVTSLLLRYGYPEELLASYIPLARTWIAAGVESLQERTLAGFDPKWWLFFERV